jgi:rhodanese-related sulfurtransferase
VASIIAITFVEIATASDDVARLQRVGVVAPQTKVTSKESSAKEEELSCDAQGITENPPVVQHKASKSDHSCLVSLSALDTLRSQKDFNFVDVRSPAEYARYRIAGSISIPLHLVKTKAFLKKFPVVLVNEGRSTTGLEKTCGELKQAGFEHLAVLDGGLFAWQANRRLLEGDLAGQSKLNRMTAQELFEERSEPDWFVIDISTQTKNKALLSWLPEKIITVASKSKSDLISPLSSTISQLLKHNPHGKLLLIADNNETYDKIIWELQKQASNILYLEGGMKAYREQVAMQLALWSQQKKPRRYEACRG